MNLFSEFADAIGVKMDNDDLHELLLNKALGGEADSARLLSYNYLSGKGVTDLDTGCPIFMRLPNAKLLLANFMRIPLLSALATQKIGLDILAEENIPVGRLYGHIGYLKAENIVCGSKSPSKAKPVAHISAHK